MVIDMNLAKLGTIEQIREFLAGTADLTFTVPTEEANRRRFVVTVVRRFRGVSGFLCVRRVVKYLTLVVS